MAPSVWFITGTTSGIGAALLNHIIERGDKVIAAGRQVEQKLSHLKSDNVAILELDITAGWKEIEAKAKIAWQIFGHIDILMNNAGISAMKSFEDADDEFVHDMFQSNVFGHLHLTRAILPLFRAQGHGCISFTSSSSAWLALPFMSHYTMTKAALSAFAESLHKEVSPLGIRCVAFDCGGFPTRLGQPRTDNRAASFGTQESFESMAPAVPAYRPLFEKFAGMFAVNPMRLLPGEPARAAVAIVDTIKGEGLAEGRPWTVRVVLGSDSLLSARRKRRQQLEILDLWQHVSFSTDGRDFLEDNDMIAFTKLAGVID